MKSLLPPLLLGALSLSGCLTPIDNETSSPAQEGPDSRATESASGGTARPIVRIETVNGSLVEMYDGGEGEVIITETQGIGLPEEVSRLQGSGLKPSEIFARLSPGKPVPQALLDAERGTEGMQGEAVTSSENGFEDEEGDQENPVQNDPVYTSLGGPSSARTGAALAKVSPTQGEFEKSYCKTNQMHYWKGTNTYGINNKGTNSYETLNCGWRKTVSASNPRTVKWTAYDTKEAWGKIEVYRGVLNFRLARRFDGKGEFKVFDTFRVSEGKSKSVWTWVPTSGSKLTSTKDVRFYVMDAVGDGFNWAVQRHVWKPVPKPQPKPQPKPEPKPQPNPVPPPSNHLSCTEVTATACYNADGVSNYPQSEIKSSACVPYGQSAMDKAIANTGYAKCGFGSKKNCCNFSVKRTWQE